LAAYFASSSTSQLALWSREVMRMPSDLSATPICFLAVWAGSQMSHLLSLLSPSSALEVDHHIRA
jgi:hypothetical protein